MKSEPATHEHLWALVQQLPTDFAPRGQRDRDIAAAAAALLGERPEEGGVFVAAGAGRAVRADAGFADFGERAPEGRPEGSELFQKLRLERGVEARVSGHAICMP